MYSECCNWIYMLMFPNHCSLWWEEGDRSSRQGKGGEDPVVLDWWLKAININAVFQYKYKNRSKEIPQNAVRKVKKWKMLEANERMDRKYFPWYDHFRHTKLTFFVSYGNHCWQQWTWLTWTWFLLQVHRRAGLNRTQNFLNNLLKLLRKELLP